MYILQNELRTFYFTYYLHLCYRIFLFYCKQLIICAKMFFCDIFVITIVPQWFSFVMNSEGYETCVGLLFQSLIITS